ncbi:MAG: CoB--CoM heterodisulfide reductase iron-sulfur subunit A family protein [Candidatus Electryoneaceae bacterium]|nr:CoB--CoM heterodisulfide reductase iron-sulfur subunit A family protein [Candidatus Electryoneaceae bacterium]
METQRIESDILNADLLVVGGGIAGVTAAVEAAETGKTVVIVEREHSLGGRVVQMHRYFPKLCPPVCGLEINFRRIRQNPDIQVLTGATATKVEGNAGDFHIELHVEPRYVNESCTADGDAEKACTIEVDDPFNFGLTKAKAVRLPHDMAFPNRCFVEPSAINEPEIKELAEKFPNAGIDLDQKPRTITVNAKAIIWATGWKPYDPNKLVELNYGKLPNIITNMEMERLTALAGPGGKVTRPSDGAELTKVAFVQCAGSRDENHLPYCSAICCMASLKQNRYLRDQYPDAEIHIFFIDARTPGRWEDFYQDVQDDPKTIIHRGKVAEITSADAGMVTVTAENTLTGKLEHIAVDLAILATGMEPNTSTEPPPMDVKIDEYGFLQRNGTEGIYAAGVATGPKDVASSVEEATGAVIRAMKHMTGS